MAGYMLTDDEAGNIGRALAAKKGLPPEAAAELKRVALAVPANAAHGAPQYNIDVANALDGAVARLRHAPD